MAADLQAQTGNVEFSFNSHRGFEQLNISCILDQLEHNGVDFMLSNASGEPPGFCSVWRCGFASGISGRTASASLFTVMRHNRSVPLAKAEE